MAIFHLRESDEPPVAAALADGTRGRAVTGSLVAHVLLVWAALRIPIEPVKVNTEAPERRAFLFSAAPLPAWEKPPLARSTPEETKIVADPTPTPVPRPTPPPVTSDGFFVGDRNGERDALLKLRRDEEIKNESGREAQTPESGASDNTKRGDGSKAATGAEEESRTDSGEAKRGRSNLGVSASNQKAGESGLLAATQRSIERQKAELDDAFSGSGKQLGRLYFDPRGADFTRWINVMSSEVYRNWFLPPIADFINRSNEGVLVFEVARDGALVGIEVLQTCGHAALDRAIVNAFRGSAFAPLPSEYPRPTFVMRVSFVYGGG